MNIDYVLQAHGIISGRKTKKENVPSAITNLKAILKEGHIQLNWNTPSDGTILTIRIQRKIGSFPNSILDGTTIFNGSANTFNDTDVVFDNNYFYRAFTLNSENIYNDDESMKLQVEYKDIFPPREITDFKSIVNSEKLHLTWINPTNEDFSKVIIRYKTNSYPTSHLDGSLAYEGKNTSCTVSNLVNNTPYYFRAFTVDRTGNMNNSTIMRLIETPLPLSTVSNIKTSANTQGTLLTISWTNPIDVSFQGVEVYISETNISLMDRNEVISNASLVSSGKINTVNRATVPNKKYYIKIFAVHNIFSTTNYSNGVATSVLVEDKEPPNIATNISISVDDAKATLSWTNPMDSDFSKVEVRYRLGAYPTSILDGNLGYSGKSNSTTISNLTNDVVHYFRLFTVDTSGNVNNSTSMQITGTPKSQVLYGVKINTTNSNPETAVTYTDMAIGFAPAKGNNGNFSYGSWQDKFPFNQIKPCVVKNGSVNYYLNPNDYTKKINGSNADITSGNDGDVMVEFPKIYWKFETVGSDLYIRYSDKKIDSTYKCLAHLRSSTEKDKIYLSAFMGYELSGKLRSLSGKAPAVNKTIGAFRTLARANGANYEQTTYFQLLMLQVLFTIMFKSRDSQTALGRGYVDGNSGSTTTGATNQKGLFYGETTGKRQNKFCGIEDFWGNTYYWIDGLYSDSNRNILIGTNNYNDTGSGYTNYGQGATSNIGGYIGTVQGGTETGFIIKATGGSATTHYSDYGGLAAGCLPLFGGFFGDASDAGAFQLQVYFSASNAYSNLSARLSLC